MYKDKRLQCAVFLWKWPDHPVLH